MILRIAQLEASGGYYVSRLPWRLLSRRLPRLSRRLPWRLPRGPRPLSSPLPVAPTVYGGARDPRRDMFRLALGLAAAFVFLYEHSARERQRRRLRQALILFGLALAATLLASTASSAPNSSGDAELKEFAVHINRTPPQPWPGYGIYLGNGLVITAAHVPGNVALTKPHVIIGGEDLPAVLVKQGSLDEIDLTLLSVDSGKLPVRLRMRRMPLCDRPSYPGEAVVTAIPEGTARSRVLPLKAVPPDLSSALRHSNRRCGHHGKLRVWSVRRVEQVLARHHEPQDFRRPAWPGWNAFIPSTLRNISFP